MRRLSSSIAATLAGVFLIVMDCEAEDPVHEYIYGTGTWAKASASLAQLNLEVAQARAKTGIFVQSEGAKTATFVSNEILGETITASMIADNLGLSGPDAPDPMTPDEAVEYVRELRRKSEEILRDKLALLMAYRMALSVMKPPVVDDHNHNELIEAILMPKRALREGRPEESESRLRELISDQPDVPAYQQLLGNALHMQGRYADAERAFHDALRLDPNHAITHANLAGTLYAQNRFDDAWPIAERAAELGHRGHWVFEDLSTRKLQQARESAQAGNADRAHEQIRQAARLPFKEARYYALLSEVYKALGDHESTEAAILTATLADPGHTEHHNDLGNALYIQGKYDSARKAYGRAVEINPREPVYQANLAGALVKLNRIDEARTHADLALKLGFTEHWVFDALGISTGN